MAPLITDELSVGPAMARWLAEYKGASTEFAECPVKMPCSEQHISKLPSRCDVSCSAASTCSTAPSTPRGPLGRLHSAKLRPGRDFSEDFQFTGKVLGSGMNGEVREAVCLHSGKRVAVKSFDLTTMSDQAIGKLKDEIELQSRMDHPGIARVEAVYVSHKKAQLVLELLEGGELFDRVVQLTEQGALSEAGAARMALRLLETVDFLHSRGVVHRDIKLENLVLERDGGDEFKLIDFGFAKSFRSGDVMTERCGTLQYAAPELLRKPQRYDSKVDIWSAGCVVYTLLTGRTLYRGSPREVLQKASRGDIDYAPAFRALSSGAQDFVRSLLVADPSKRPDAAKALRHPWLRHSAAAEASADAAETEAAPVPCEEPRVRAPAPKGSSSATRTVRERALAKAQSEHPARRLLESLRDFAVAVCGSA